MSCGCNQSRQSPLAALPVGATPPVFAIVDIDTNSTDARASMIVQMKSDFRFSIRRLDDTVIGNTVVKVVARLSGDDPNWTELSIEDRITGEGMSLYPIDVSGVYEVAVQISTLSGTTDTRARVVLYAE